MKAFLLAAGYGSRLKPITDTIPKCLVPIDDKPLLQYWIELFERYGIDDVLINSHYLSEQVENFLLTYSGNITFHLIHEPQLLGSGGTLYANKNFIDSNEPFFIFYADVLTNIDLNKMLSFHNDNNTDFTMGLFYTNNPKGCGIAELNESNDIVSFIEKPEEPKSNLANAGIYITNRNIFQYIPVGMSDFGKDILPNINKKGYLINDYLLDIGTVQNYNKANEEVKHGLFKSSKTNN